jgi:hypothetical protein
VADASQAGLLRRLVFATSPELHPARATGGPASSPVPSPQTTTNAIRDIRQFMVIVCPPVVGKAENLSFALPWCELGQVARWPHLTFVGCRESEAGNKNEFRELRLRGNTAPARKSVLRPYANVPSVAR